MDKILCYVLEKEGGKVIYADFGSLKDHLEAELEESTVGEEFKVFTRIMTEKEFEDLPEYDGF